MMLTRFYGRIAFLIVVLWLTGLDAQDRNASYYPLDPGNTWEYRLRNDPFEGNFWRSRVERRRGDIATLSFELFFAGEPEASFVLVLRDNGNEIDIDIPGEGFQAFYRFDQETFFHRDPTDVCDDGKELETMLASSPVETPAGMFSGCLRVSFPGGNCADGGRLTEWWCRGVGLVLWHDLAADTLDIWALASLDRPLFRRGDANADGGLDVSDPIAVLSRLFVGEGELSCEDAADADDNGSLEVTDAISILQHLFVDSSAGLPEPFGPCGPDPRGDGLGVCSYEACE